MCLHLRHNPSPLPLICANTVHFLTLNLLRSSLPTTFSLVDLFSKLSVNCWLHFLEIQTALTLHTLLCLHHSWLPQVNYFSTCAILLLHKQSLKFFFEIFVRHLHSSSWDSMSLRYKWLSAWLMSNNNNLYSFSVKYIYIKKNCSRTCLWSHYPVFLVRIYAHTMKHNVMLENVWVHLF